MMKKSMILIWLLNIFLLCCAVSSALADVTLPVSGLVVSDIFASGPYYQKLLEAMENSAGMTPQERFVHIALSQQGYRGGTKASDISGTSSSLGEYTEYGWRMNKSGLDWCATYVSWCARAAGLSQSVLPDNAVVRGWMSSSKGTFTRIWSDDFSSYNSDYEPEIGDLVMWSPTHSVKENGIQLGCQKHYNGWEKSAHVAIVIDVQKQSNGSYSFTTIERNGNVVGQRVFNTFDKCGKKYSCQCVNGASNPCTCDSTTVATQNAYKFLGFYRPDWSKATVWTEEMLNQQPQGWLDVAEGGMGTLNVAGWAKDPDTLSTPLTLHVYVGGEAGTANAEMHEITTDVYRADLGGYYGFDAIIPVSISGMQAVYVYALDSEGGANPCIGQSTVAITANPVPVCTLAACEWTDSGLYVKGTAQDPDAPDAAVELHIYVGGQPGSGAPFYSLTTNGTSNTGSNHDFEGILPVTLSGELPIYFYALNLPEPAVNPCFATQTIAIPADTTPPVISNVQISDVSCEGYTITCHVAESRGLNRVAFPSWSVPDDQDDLRTDWENTSLGTIGADGTVTYRVNTRSHGHQTACSYVTHIYAWDHAGNVSSVSDEQYSQLKVDVPWPVLDVNVSDVSPAGYKVSCALDPAWNPTTAIFPTWTVDNGQDDLDPNWSSNALGSINSDGTVTYQVYTANHGGQIGCEYITHIYLFDDMGNQLLLDDGTFSLLRLSVPFMMDPDVVLPESLLVIDAEAFCGLPVKTVYCNSGLTTINENAFANCAYLTGIYLPVTVTHIDPTAFSGCPSDLIIFAVKNSYAAQFSQDYGYSLIEVSE